MSTLGKLVEPAEVQIRKGTESGLMKTTMINTRLGLGLGLGTTKETIIFQSKTIGKTPPWSQIWVMYYHTVLGNGHSVAAIVNGPVLNLFLFEGYKV